MKNSFCGLVTTGDSPADIKRLLERTVGSTGSHAASNAMIRTSRSSGIAVTGADAALCVIDEDGLVGAVSGTPYWSSDDLENARRELGFVRSVVSAYREHGEGLLRFLRGAFSLALSDPAARKSILAIDRMGISQLYFSRRPGGGVAFGTSAGQLAQLDEPWARVSDKAIYEYLYFHMVPSPRAVFENQRKLRPGEYLVQSGDEIRTQPYWSVEFEDSGQTNRRELENELQDLLRQSVRRLSPDEKCGCFLSGGIDSSTIAGLMSEVEPPAKTFTIGFQERGYDETSFARITSEHFDTIHEEYCVTPADVVDILPTIAHTYDEPFGNSSVVPTYFCARMARDSGIDTLFGGDGGDEIFAGNVRYVTQQVFSMYERVPSALRKALVEPAAFGWPGADRFLPTRKLQSYIRQATVPMPDRLETYNYFNRTPVENILHPVFFNAVDTQSPAKALRETYETSSGASMLNRMLHLDWKFTLADNDLRKVVSMCDLAGIGVRFPFLDDDLVEFSARVPSSMKINRFRLRHFFKRAMRSYLPPEVLRKSKHGFGLPFGIWMRSYQPLQELAYDCLSDIGKRNIVQASYLDELIHAHRSAHAHYYGEFIWVLMMAELWFKAHNTGYEAGGTS